jgi:hypothetical protein
MDFTPQQQHSLLTKMGYTGPVDPKMMEAFLSSNPGASAKMGKFSRAMQRGFATGGLTGSGGFSSGGFDVWKTLENLKNPPNPVPTPMPELPAPVPEGPTEPSPGSILVEQLIQDPSKLTVPSEVAKVEETPGTTIEEGVGQAASVGPAAVTKAPDAQTAEVPVPTPTSLIEAAKVTPQIEEALSGLKAAEATPTKEATVQGQLEQLMKQFEGGQTPAWAAGALRAAQAAMAQRGLGASSMAGQAITQAAMESALPIAQQDASTRAQFEAQNLSNRQQTELFRSQSIIQSLFTDQAVENAARQFNAASENQTKQFFADLGARVAQFNADQINAINQFNAGQENAAELFSKQLEAARNQFNAGNSLIIAQANAQWRQNINTMNTAAQNEANMELARVQNAMTVKAMDELWQKERDLLNFAFLGYEKSEDRFLSLALADKEFELAKYRQDQENQRAMGAGLAGIFGSIFKGIFG